MGENSSEVNFLRDMEAMLDRKNLILEKKINTNTDTQIATLSNNITKLAKENEAIKTVVKNHDERLENIEKRNNTQDSIDRSANIVIYGIQGNNFGDILDKVLVLLKNLVPEVTKYQIKGLIKLGKGGWNTDGPIKANLTSSILKNDIMRSKHKIQNKTIRITEDLTPETREIRKKLAPFSLAEKNKGHKVFMRRDSLVINGRAWTLSELENKEDVQMEMENPTQQLQTNNENKALKRNHIEIISPGKNQSGLSKKNKTTSKPILSLNTALQRNLHEMWTTPQNNAKDDVNKAVSTPTLIPGLPTGTSS